MPKIRYQWVFTVSMFLMALNTAVPVHGQNPPAPPDSTLYTNYTLSSGNQTVNWIVCGSTQQSSGCYAAGSLGPFVNAGALMEGNPVVNGNTVTRAIYVVDSGSASVKLYVYKKTDTVTPQTDTVTVTLNRTANLSPLVGGSTVSCSMAANNRFLFIGTDQSPQAVEVNKSTLSVAAVGGFSPPLNVTAITADKYGYVTVTQGNFFTGFNGFYVFGPDGSGKADGGGADFMLNTVNAVSTSTLPQSDVQPTQRLGYWPK
jgi:hypothetical protein